MNVEVKARASVFDDCQQNLGRGAPTLLAIHVLVVALGLPSPDCQGESNAAEPAPTFERDVAPLFQARCVKCHGPAKQEGSLDLSTAVGVERGGQSGAAIQAGGLIDNKIWARVSTGEMPPDEPLSDEERLILKAWISQSAADWPPIDRIQAAPLEHWSFRGPQPVIVPQVRNESACRNEIDRFLQAALESRGLGIGPEANRLTLLRRVSFDLTGLPPTVDEIADYLVDSRDDAYERIVEHYLNSPRFGERWGKYWLDVAGYADSDGYFDYDAVRPLAFRYRDYVIRSINSDKPFDQFIREQLAGDELVGSAALLNPTPRDVELFEATHFLRNAEDGTGASNGNPTGALQDRQAVLDATTEILGSALFGLSMQCAKCHDHRFEPVTQREYYGLQAVLAPAFNVHKWLVPAERFVVAATVEENKAHAAALEQGQLLDADCLGKIAAVRDLSPIPPDVFVLRRGEITAPGEKVTPIGLLALTDSDNVLSQPSREATGDSTGIRLAFARWLTMPGGRPAALLARLHVNRIWQQYFGVGLVATASNFGYGGQRPSHPELLEWLAGKLVDSRWSSKTVHRLIAGSAAYRQSSAFRADAYASDPDNRLLWRMPLKRLDAEQIYDAMLAASGELDLTAFGPATQIILRGNGEVAVADTLPGGRRRAVYLLQRRTQTPTMLRVFDAPSLVTNCVKRDSSTVPQQALTLLNSDSTRRRAANLARRVAMEAGSNNDERIARAFMLVFGHKPDGEETRSSLRFIRDQSRHYVNTNRTPQRGVWTDFCNSLFASNAFLYVD